MDDFELRLLTKEEAYIDDEDENETTALEVLRKKDNVSADNTDLSCLTGSYTDANDTSFYSLQPDLSHKKFYYVDDDCYIDDKEFYSRFNAVRPVLYFLNSTAYRDHLIYDKHRLTRLKYGEYPQYVLNENSNEKKIMNELNKKLIEQTLTKTGKTYCFYYGESGKRPSMCYGIEYLYKGKKYMPFISTIYQGADIYLSTGDTIDPYRIYWLKVEPITWLYDENTALFISEKALVSGVGFEFVKKGNNYEATEMYEFLNMHLKQDIIPSRIIKEDKSSLLDGSESLKKYVYKNYGRRG